MPYGVQRPDIEFIAADSHCVYSITARSYTALSSDGRDGEHPEKEENFQISVFRPSCLLFP